MFLLYSVILIIFNVITIEDPFPIPFSVIKSLNQRIIIDPVVRARTISLHIAKFQLNKIGRNEKAIEKLSKIAINNVKERVYCFI